MHHECCNGLQNMKTSHPNVTEGKIRKAVILLQGDDETSLQDVLEAWALLIRTGMTKKLFGPYREYADTFIQSGAIDQQGNINYEIINQIKEELDESEQQDRKTLEGSRPEDPGEGGEVSGEHSSKGRETGTEEDVA